MMMERKKLLTYCWLLFSVAAVVRYIVVDIHNLKPVISVSVIGPRVVRPYSPYRVAVAPGSRAQTLYIAIEGRLASGEQFAQGREVQVQPGTSRIVDLEVANLEPGQYELVSRSTSGPLFSSAAKLIYQARSFCVFMQTDKRVYKPGDSINFRVIALDKYLLPISGTVDVSVVDAKGSPVRQWALLPLDKGVLSQAFKLADEPSLGVWTIEVEARGQKYKRQILVADYFLPKFQMDIIMPKELLFTEGRFTVNVTAKHFNGQPVRGELTLSSYAVFFSGVLQPVFASPARKVVEFDGTAEVTYDLKTDLELAEDAARPLVIEAVLEEKDTLIRQNVTAKILLLRTPYRLKVTAPDYFKPDLPYNVQIEVVDSSGKVMESEDEIVIERLWDDGAPANVTRGTLNKGRALYTFTPDVAHARSNLNLLITYKEISERVVNVQSSTASGGQYLTIEILTRSSSVGGEMRARITSTEPMDLIHYAVVGRGDILIAKTVELSPARRSVDVSINVSPAMAPGCTVLAWYPRLDPTADIILASAVYAPQQKLLQHKVSMQVIGSDSRPGGSVEFRVSGEDGAHAALLAEDSKAIQAGLAAEDGLGNGLNMHTVEREVESFNGLMHSFYKNEDYQPSLGFDLGGNTTTEVFQNAGVVILTDGVVVTNSGETKPRQVLPETGTRPPLAGPYAFSRIPPPPAPRYYLMVNPEPTWMLANFTLGGDGKGTISRRTPITSAEWTVGGFAVHPTLGLGLAEPQTFTTEVPLAISAELPGTLQKGETVAAIIILKSSLTVDTSVEITFHNSEQYFEFEPLENSVDSNKKIELFRRIRVTVPAKGSVSTAFLLTVVRSGDAAIIVEATGNGVSASLFRTISVKDGYDDEIWSWSLVDGRRGVTRVNVTLEPPAGVKLGTTSLMAAGDILAPALHTSRMMTVPATDPAYALRPLAIATVLLDYLQSTRHDEIAVTTEAKEQAAFSYQRLMAYMTSDGSFAAELNNDAEGDVWMTAVAARWIARSAKYVEVSPGAALTAANWLADKQESDGSWRPPAPSRIHDPRAQRVLPLTAHALLALLSVPSSDYRQRNAINKATEFLSSRLSSDLDAYTLAILATALGTANNAQGPIALQYLDAYTNATGGISWWERQLSGSEWRNPWLKGNSAEAATASWGLRAMLSQRLIEQSLPVARFLLYAFRPQDMDPDQLEALSELAQSIRTATKMRLSVNVTGLEEPKHFNIDDDNYLIMQTQIVRNVRSGTVRNEGRGIAVVGLSAKTSTNVTGPWPRYTLDPRVDAVSTRYRLQLSICIGFVPQGNETASGLALLTVQLPSGYLADINTITDLTSLPGVTWARLSEEGARVSAAVRGLIAPMSEKCVTLAAPRALAVARQRPGYVTLLDLYDSSHRARVFFQPVTASACDVCRVWQSCASACGLAERQRAADSSSTSTGGGVSGDKSRNAVAHGERPLLTPLLTIATLLLLILN